MNQKTTAYRYFFLFPLFCMLLSCTQDSYEKGEGRYSQMRGDFAEMHINSDKKAFSITTDDGDEFPLKEQFASQWIDTPDTRRSFLLGRCPVRMSSRRKSLRERSVQIPLSLRASG